MNLQNSDAIVEYEEKVRLTARLLAIKKFNGLHTYSLLDLLNAKARGQTWPTDGHPMECSFNHGAVGVYECVPVCTKCKGCLNGKRRTNCSTRTDLQWEDKGEQLKSESHPST